MNKDNISSTQIQSKVVKINHVQHIKTRNYIMRMEKLIGSTMSSRPTIKMRLAHGDRLAPEAPLKLNLVMALKKKNIENLIH